MPPLAVVDPTISSLAVMLASALELITNVEPAPEPPTSILVPLAFGISCTEPVAPALMEPFICRLAAVMEMVPVEESVLLEEIMKPPLPAVVIDTELVPCTAASSAPLTVNPPAAVRLKLPGAPEDARVRALPLVTTTEPDEVLAASVPVIS